MGRRSSSFGGGGFTFRPSLPRLPRFRPRPAAAPSPPPQTGLGFGTGNGIAQRALDTVMGPRTIRYETVASEADSASSVENSLGSGSCGIQVSTFVDCINEFSSDISKCQFYMDTLTECKKNSGSKTAA